MKTLEEMEQSEDERTFEDAQSHLIKTYALIEMFLERKATLKTLESAHDAAIKAFNTVKHLEELAEKDIATRAGQEFTKEDVMAAWQDGYEAGLEA